MWKPEAYLQAIKYLYTIYINMCKSCIYIYKSIVDCIKGKGLFNNFTTNSIRKTVKIQRNIVLKQH